MIRTYLLTKNQEDLNKFNKIMRGEVNNYLELALGWFLYRSNRVANLCPTASPLIQYYIGYCLSLKGFDKEAKAYFSIAESVNPIYCFPNKLDEILILMKAIELNPTVSCTFYDLGNLWYDKKQYDTAII